jgi:hypothetical protein
MRNLQTTALQQVLEIITHKEEKVDVNLASYSSNKTGQGGDENGKN